VIRLLCSLVLTAEPQNDLWGLQVQVPIVIVAEDGVTSLRYYVSVTRDLPSGNASLESPTAGPGARAAAEASPGASSPAQAAVDRAIAESPLSAILNNMTKARPCLPYLPAWLQCGDTAASRHQVLHPGISLMQSPNPAGALSRAACPSAHSRQDGMGYDGRQEMSC
jgi:hypothetical protein